MKKQLPLALLFILLLIVVMSAWVKQMKRPSLGEELSYDVLPTVTQAAAPQEPLQGRDLILVDFFAGY